MTSSKARLSSKTEEIFQSLVEIAEGLEPEAKLPTVQQLRRDFGVSIATLDSILSRLESQHIIYRRQGSGIYVSPYLRKKRVGLVCTPDVFRAGSSPFWTEMVDGVRQRAASLGEVFRFYLALPAARSQFPVHEDLQDDVLEQRLDGVFFVGNNPAAIEWLEEHDIPVVAFAGRGIFKVEIDYLDLIDQGVEILTQKGCRRIGLMSPFHYREENEDVGRSTTARHFDEVMAHLGPEYQNTSIWDARSVADAHKLTYPEMGSAAIAELFAAENPTRPDGLVVLDDMMTRGALVALRSLGLRVGQDVQLVSHTNRGSTVLQDFEDQPIALEIEPGQIVQSMFDLLHTRMNQGPVTSPVLQMKACRKMA